LPKEFKLVDAHDGHYDSDGNYRVKAEQVSDGYHTMHELYQHRMALNIALFHTLDELYNRNGLSMAVPKVYKAKNHHPTSDPMFDGYFIVFCVEPKTLAWTSYHYALKHWDRFRIRIAEFSPPYPLNHVDSITFFENLCWRDE
jgi:hypothetical protein